MLACRGRRIALTLAACLPMAAGAQSVAPGDTSIRVTFGAFVDGYFAWDFGRPASFDRSFAGGTPFTTQPARHDEFNVNLAYVEAKVDGSSVRGRLAFQTGTSVQSNYAGEPTKGQVSGPVLARLLQEAVAGVKHAPNLWVAGDIDVTHLGREGWVSRDDPVYTRSLVADYSPYYQSGVKLTWTPTPRLIAQLDVVNGWQNVSENNTGKGAGVRLDYALTPGATASYYNFFSDETGNRLRTFNGVGARATVGPATLLGEVDVGTQARSSASGGTATWYGYTALARVALWRSVALSGRVERYDDRDQVIVATGSAAPGVANGPFRAHGASVGLDVTPQRRVLWRTELRGFRNRTAIFPNGPRGAPKRTSAFAVSSLALTI